MAPSFYEIEQQKVRELIKEPLLLLVLEHLPHIQSSSKEQQDVWEIVATKLNTITYQDALSSKDNRADELPILNGGFVQKVFDELMDAFTKVESQKYRVAPGGILEVSLPKREAFQLKSDRILCELFYLKHYDIEVIAKLSKENFERNLKNKQQQGAEDLAQITTDTLLQLEKQKQLEQKLLLLEEKLQKKDKQLEKLTNDNKALLELNHELISRR